ncbi:MAG: aminodeoxychorismate lyase [Halofilum sp. (in: g-proteobacteria)]|nr:aminodeoxychorismate lyase [Halofilum sp. (in: g-proteobacteria)]
MPAAASSPSILVNGSATDQAPALDRGLALGDGLFETIAFRDGRPRHWREHAERLADGCRRLDLPQPDPEQLRAEAERARGTDPDGTLRITWTRGPGPRGYAPPVQPRPTRIVAWFPGLPAAPGRPLALRWCDTRLGENPALAGLKHLNRLEQVLARAEWDDPAIDEGVMCSSSGEVIECTSSNLFLVRDGRLRTPALERCGVAGVVRRRVLALAAEAAIPAAVEPLSPDDVRAADELFVTSATRGIAAVGRLGERAWSAPGPCTRRLQQALAEATP